MRRFASELKPGHRAKLHARGWAYLGLIACISSMPAVPASAADPTDASTALFRDGRFLLNKGRFAEACEKFRASLELRRTPGTLLNVANCQESGGDVAAALESLEAALSLAAREPDQRKSAGWMAAARDAIGVLEPRVAQLTVQASSEPAPAVTLDGQRIATFDRPLRLNPGHHSLEAAAPRRKPFVRELDLAAGEPQTVVIPELELDTPVPLPEPVPTPPAITPEVPAPTPRVAPPAELAPPSRALPWSLVGIGSALLVGGAVAGVVAAQRADDLERDCPDHRCASLSARDRGKRMAVVADVLLGAGLLSAGVGVTLLVTAQSRPAAQLTLGCGPASCGAAWGGDF